MHRKGKDGAETQLQVSHIVIAFILPAMHTVVTMNCLFPRYSWLGLWSLTVKTGKRKTIVLGRDAHSGPFCVAAHTTDSIVAFSPFLAEKYNHIPGTFTTSAGSNEHSELEFHQQQKLGWSQYVLCCYLSLSFFAHEMGLKLVYCTDLYYVLLSRYAQSFNLPG